MIQIPKQLTKNFHRREFDCKDGTKVPAKFKINLLRLAQNLQAVRDDLGAPITINSGYRTPSHNEAVGGVDGSAHTFAMAADLSQSKETPLELYKRIECLIFNGEVNDGGLFLYNTFVHYDIRDTPTRANYSNIFTL